MDDLKKIPTVFNGVLFGFLLTVNFFQFYFLPFYLLPENTAWGWVVVPLVFLNNLQWSLIHEAIHKLVNSEKTVNDLMGRALSVVFGASFEVLRFGHLMHHRFNRTLHTEFCPGDWKEWIKTAPDYYFNLFFGIYFLEVISTYAIAFLPRRILEKLNHSRARDAHGKPLPELREAVGRYFFKEERMQRVRTDTLLVTLFFVGSIAVYGGYWPVLAGIIIGRAFVISFHDNVYHYGTAEDNSMPAKELKLSRPLSLCLLNFNYHTSHHLVPSVPWSKLPELHKIKDNKFDMTFSAALKDQLHGPIMKAN